MRESGDEVGIEKKENEHVASVEDYEKEKRRERWQIVFRMERRELGSFPLIGITFSQIEMVKRTSNRLKELERRSEHYTLDQVSEWAPILEMVNESCRKDERDEGQRPH